MSLAALAITATLQSLTADPGMVSCTFPATAPDEPTIRLAVEARPSLLDFGERYRVLLHVDDAHEVGLAQPIDRTDARDVLIRAKAFDDVIYTIGLRDDGIAALNLLHVDGEDDAGRNETREGECSDYIGLMNAWLRS